MSNEAAQYVPGFVANLSLTPQQTTPRLVHAVDANLAYTKEGKMFNADDIDEDDDELEVQSRAPNSPESFANHLRRVGFFKAYQKGRFIENLDVVRMMQDPTNTIMAGMMATKNRATDDKIIEGLFASSRNGETGETVTAFPAAQIIAVDNDDFKHQSEAGTGDLPLTIGKLIKAKVMLDQSELEGQRYVAATAEQLGHLLTTTAATSSDYAGVKALVNGDVNTLMGFTFIRTERLPVASAVRSCAAWIKPAMQYRERPIQNAWIRPRDDRSGRLYAYYEVERGSLRRYDNAVVKILCKDAA